MRNVLLVKKIGLKMNSKSNESEVKKSPNTLISWLSLGMTTIGTLLWVSGAAFSSGYWNLVEWGGPIITNSIQETMLLGFVGAAEFWFYTFLLMIGLGVLIIFLSIDLVRPIARLPRWCSAIINWFSTTFRVDLFTLNIGTLLITWGLVTFFLMAFLFICVHFSVSAGEREMMHKICEVRKGKITFPTTLALADGTKISGKLLERSDKFGVLLNKEAILMVIFGEKSQITDSTSLSGFKCEK